MPRVTAEQDRAKAIEELLDTIREWLAEDLRKVQSGGYGDPLGPCTCSTASTHRLPHDATCDWGRP